MAPYGPLMGQKDQWHKVAGLGLMALVSYGGRGHLLLLIMKQFAITAEGFELPDYVYAETEEEAVLEWARMIVEVQVTEIEQN